MTHTHHDGTPDPIDTSGGLASGATSVTAASTRSLFASPFHMSAIVLAVATGAGAIGAGIATGSLTETVKIGYQCFRIAGGAIEKGAFGVAAGLVATESWHYSRVGLGNAFHIGAKVSFGRINRFFGNAASFVYPNHSDSSRRLKIAFGLGVALAFYGAVNAYNSSKIDVLAAKDFSSAVVEILDRNLGAAGEQLRSLFSPTAPTPQP